MIADWIKEWAIPLSAGVTFFLAIAAFWAIWQNYTFRKNDRKRERIMRSAEELYRWAEESLRLFYLPYNANQEEIYNGFTGIVNKAVAATASAKIVGDKFTELVDRAFPALSSFYSIIKEKRRQGHKQAEEQVVEEFKISFSDLTFHLDLLRTWDYDYRAFIKEVRAHDFPTSAP